MREIVYCLPDGRYWSTEKAQFVDSEYAEAWLTKNNYETIPLSPVDKNGERTLEGLHDALKFYGFELGDLATDIDKFKRLREIRDEKLSKTDYLMIDYPLSEELKNALKDYRQTLRDLPSQEGAPWDGGGELTPWPTEPSI